MMDKIDGILADLNDMSPETANQLLSSAFTGYIMRKENCTAKEAVERMGMICDMTQKAIAHGIMSQVVQ